MPHSHNASTASKNFTVHQARSLTSWMVHLVDFLAVCFAGWLAYQLRFALGAEGWEQLRPNESMLTLGAAGFTALFSSKVYRMWPGGALAAMVWRVTLGWALTWTLIIFLLVFSKSAESYSRGWILAWAFTGAVTLWIGRVCAFFAMVRMRKAGYHHKAVVLVGNSDLLNMVRGRIQSATWSGYSIKSSFDASQLGALYEYVNKNNPDEIWISWDSNNKTDLTEILAVLKNSVSNIRLLPDLMMYRILNHGMTVTMGIPMVDLSISPMFGSRHFAKTVLDYSIAVIALLLVSPLFILIAIAVKITSEGPVFFKQKRHGWNNEEIWIYKFRSMELHQEAQDTVTQAVRGDSRLTPIGGFLRKTSLDELPQFINVLQGRMSIVGPRPHALQHNKEYIEKVPKYALRHKVKPGITGWAQVCGHRGETDTLDKMEMRVKHDIFYLENWSLWMDLKIIFLTPFAILQNKNVH